MSVDFDKHLVNVSLTARKSVAGRVDSDLVVYLERYYSLVLLIFGTIGNLLCLAVLSRKTFRSVLLNIVYFFLNQKAEISLPTSFWAHFVAVFLTRTGPKKPNV